MHDDVVDAKAAFSFCISQQLSRAQAGKNQVRKSEMQTAVLQGHWGLRGIAL